MIRQVAAARLPTRHGEFSCQVWAGRGIEHLALVRGDVGGPRPTLVRVHSECLTGDVLGSLRCDCGSQLDDALRMIARERSGLVVYLRGQEGRGIGLGHKLAAYRLQDEGHDTVDANLRLGLPVDAREYGTAAAILEALGVRQARLITNNPKKCRALQRRGIAIAERVPLPTRVTGDNVRYLRTKQQRMGHLLDLVGD